MSPIIFFFRNLFCYYLQNFDILEEFSKMNTCIIDEKFVEKIPI